MERVFVVVRLPLDAGSLRLLDGSEGAAPCEFAVCCVLPSESDGLEQALRAQRELTAALRRALGERAEMIPVFVASDREGEGVEECARSWGATLVKS